MLLQEEADAIVSETVLDTSVGVAAKIIKESMQTNVNNWENEINSEFYPYPNELNIKSLTAEVPLPLKNFLDTIYKRRDASDQKRKLKKVAVAHAIMQFSKKEGYVSPLLLAIGLFVHKVSRSKLLVDVLHSVGQRGSQI